MRNYIILLALFIYLNPKAQTIQTLDSGTKASIRGLSVVNDSIFWASGSNGKVARSTNGGKTIQWLTVPGYEKRDFRDVEAFDASTAIIMAIAEPAVILKTKDAGKTWKKVFEDSTKGMFLDAMDFGSNGVVGIVVGDPINNKAFIAFTVDRGETWNQDTRAYDTLVAGEAFFASSGTNVEMISGPHQRTIYLQVTGGKQSRFFKNGKVVSSLNLASGKESTGANSFAMYKRKNVVVVGGDFTNDTSAVGNCLLSSDFGKTWKQPTIQPHGYRSCVAFITNKKLITCGTSGVDISEDWGYNWRLISNQSFHVCQKAKWGTAVYLAGANGRIAKLR